MECLRLCPLVLNLQAKKINKIISKSDQTFQILLLLKKLLQVRNKHLLFFNLPLSSFHLLIVCEHVHACVSVRWLASAATSCVYAANVVA